MGMRDWFFQHWFQQKQSRMMRGGFNALAARIDADTDHFRVAGDANWLVNTASPRSFSYWIKSNDGAWKTNAFHLCVGNTGGGAGSRFNALMFGARDTTSGWWAGRLPTTADDNGQHYLWTAPAATTGLWRHVLVVVDFAQAQLDRMRLYVDGSLVTLGGGIGTTATSFFASSQPFAIGSNSAGQTTRTINDSSLDEFAIYNTALGAADALEHYNGGRSRDLRSLASASGLMSYWRFGDTPGDTVSAVQDLVGGRTLTGFGAPTFEGGTP